MSTVYAKDVINWCNAQVGYSSGSTKSSKYLKVLDSVNWYNYKKDGSCNWCAGFNDCGVYECIDDKNVNFGRSVVCEPNKDNCGAGCKWKVDYYKQAGRWYSKHSDAQSGDEIFFWASSYKSSQNPYGVYHTGRIVDWDSKGFYVVEGNTNGGSVARKFYAYGTGKILGFGRPKWTGWERPQPEKKIITVELPVLKLGDQGGEVLTIQMLLNEIGFRDQNGKKLKEDRYFGTATQYALTNYQKARGLTVTGICDYETWNRILK